MCAHVKILSSEWASCKDNRGELKQLEVCMNWWLDWQLMTPPPSNHTPSPPNKCTHPLVTLGFSCVLCIDLCLWMGNRAFVIRTEEKRSRFNASFIQTFGSAYSFGVLRCLHHWTLFLQLDENLSCIASGVWFLCILRDCKKDKQLKIKFILLFSTRIIFRQKKIEICFSIFFSLLHTFAWKRFQAKVLHFCGS